MNPKTVLGANVRTGAIAAQIHSVCRAAYATEAEQIGCTDFPPLRETIGDLQLCTDEFLVVRRGGRIVGVLSFEESEDVATITRLAVDPAHLRQGIATALLAALERRVPFAASVNVSTAEANVAAVSLYERAGYMRLRSNRSMEGIALVHFAKHRELARGGATGGCV